ncbi:hypothetical protein ACMXYX_18015 (plasmid) [Neptuniibacter sp. QD72_48]|uniref:hypothetical protein n=1 Tax=Neptuniibacter sp. QD72_48 TaxID=3398214 RepID=UPI0039F47749
MKNLNKELQLVNELVNPYNISAVIDNEEQIIIVHDEDSLALDYLANDKGDVVVKNAKHVKQMIKAGQFDEINDQNNQSYYAQERGVIWEEDEYCFDAYSLDDVSDVYASYL